MFTKNILSKAKQAKEGTDLLNSKGGTVKPVYNSQVGAAKSVR
jgi:hypothetical protein